MEELSKSLKKRGYPVAIINDAISKASNLERTSLLSPKRKSDETVVPYVSTFNPHNPEIFRNIRSNHPILDPSETMRNALFGKAVIKS